MKKNKDPLTPSLRSGQAYSSPQWGEDIMFSLSPWGRLSEVKLIGLSEAESVGGQGEGAFLLILEFTRDKKTYVGTRS
jgi:hypothetical protein